MTLDDRLRGAGRRRLDDTRQRLGPVGASAVGSAAPLPAATGRYQPSRLMAIAAVVAVAALASIVALDPPWLDRAASIDADRGGAAGLSSAAELSDVCPSGERASLEDASLSYVGANQGWGRLDDLVDEQDGPYYFSGWEPGYPDAVTVEVVLAEPVLAQDMRLAQDPYSPTEGLVAIGVVGSGFNMELSGTGGWQIHDFGDPFPLDRFTITRNGRKTNVMEVLVCLAEPRPDATTSVPPTTSLPTTSVPDATTTTEVDPDVTTTTGIDPDDPVDPADPHPETVGVRDSFGEMVAPRRDTMAWRAVDSYYEQVGTGRCSQDLHDSYWVEGADGRIYPTWHPVVHASGCSFQHSHGDDPRGSVLYDPSQGLPFGMAAQAQDPGDPVRRNEDHVGHKIVRQDEWRAVNGNPVNDGATITRTDTTCNWLSKIHQGTYSIDALGNNLHEYFINLRCNDGTEIRIKQLIFFGRPSQVFHQCSDQNADRFGLPRSGWIDAGVTARPALDPPFFHDGKREFSCIPDVLYRGDGALSELWKPDGGISTPEGGSAIFSPYYIVTNPARVIDPDWRRHGLPNAYVNTIDLCFSDTAAWRHYVARRWDLPGGEGFRDKPPTFCRDVPAGLDDVPTDQRWSHPDSPFDGSATAIHPKSVQIFNGGRTKNHPDGTLFCTDARGGGPRWPDRSGSCGPNQLAQLIGTLDNEWGDRNINGSDVNAAGSGSSLTAPGIAHEWERDSGDAVNVPN